MKRKKKKKIFKPIPQRLRNAENRLTILFVFPYIYDSLLFLILRILSKVYNTKLRSSIKRQKVTKLYELNVYDKSTQTRIFTTLRSKKYKVYKDMIHMILHQQEKIKTL